MDRFEIKIKVNDESELYNSFDPEGLTLGEDILAYLTERYSEKGFGKKSVLTFSGADVDAEHLKIALRHHIKAELDKVEKQKRLNIIKQLRLLLIGVVFIAAGIFFSGRSDSVPIEILSIVGSFSVWEAANIWIVENPTLKMRKRLLTHLLEADIAVKADGN